MERELTEMSPAELEVELRDWKRWRARVMTSSTMRLRRERYEEACDRIAAIEEELRLRTPEVRERMLDEAATRVRTIVSAPTVRLDAFRRARREHAAIEKRKPRGA